MSVTGYWWYWKNVKEALSKHLLVALQLECGRNSEEAVCSGVVDQRAGQQETREEPAEGVAVLLEEHQHPVHRLDTQGVVTWQRERVWGGKGDFSHSYPIKNHLGNTHINTWNFWHVKEWKTGISIWTKWLVAGVLHLQRNMSFFSAKSIKVHVLTNM